MRSRSPDWMLFSIKCVALKSKARRAQFLKATFQPQCKHAIYSRRNDWQAAGDKGMEERLIKRSIAISPGVSKQRADPPLRPEVGKHMSVESGATNFPLLFSLQ